MDGTMRSALRHRDFRIVFFGMFASNIGTWMQNVVVMALAYDMTHEAKFVGLVAFANFLPSTFLSLIGGAIADRFDRKRLLVLLSYEQLASCALLGWIATSDHPSRPGLLIAVLLTGIGFALQGPVFSSVTTTLTPRDELRGVVALNQVSWNFTRVIGPVIGGLLYASVGAPWVFYANAVSFAVMVIALAPVRVPTLERRVGDGPRHLLLGGFSYLQREPVARRAIIAVTVFALFSLVFISQMAVVAERNLDIAAKSGTYGALYAMLGAGAVVGSYAIGTAWVGRHLERVVQGSYIGFGVSSALLALVRSPLPAFLLTFVVGVFYFAALTSVSSVFQARLHDEIRGRASAVWLTAAVGTAPLANIVGGWAIDATSVTTVMLVGAAVAVGVGWWADLRDRGPVTLAA